MKVTDFGLAKLVGAATRTITFKGGQHILYMAPEAWEGCRNDIQIDMYSAGLVLIGSFNEHTEGPMASIAETGQGQYRINLPFAEPATLSFLCITPPLRIDHRFARFGARVADGKGCGFNLLLMRGQREQYGEWAVCRVRVNPISGRAHRHCKYFGFDPGEIREIERGHRAMHVYVPEFTSEVDAAIRSFVQALYSGDQ